MEKIKKMLVSRATRRLGLLEYDIERNIEFSENTIWMARKTLNELLCVTVEYKKGRRVLTFNGRLEDTDLVNNYNFFYFSQVLNYAFSYENIELFFRELLENILSKTIDMTTSMFILDLIKRELSRKQDVVEVVEAADGAGAADGTGSGAGAGAGAEASTDSTDSPMDASAEETAEQMADSTYKTLGNMLDTIYDEFKTPVLFKNNKYDHHKVKLFRILRDMKREPHGVMKPEATRTVEQFLLGKPYYQSPKAFNLPKACPAGGASSEESQHMPWAAVRFLRAIPFVAPRVYYAPKVQDSKNDLNNIIISLASSKPGGGMVQIWLDEAKALSPNYDGLADPQVGVNANQITAYPKFKVECNEDIPQTFKLVPVNATPNECMTLADEAVIILEQMKVTTILSYTLNKVEIAINQQIDKLYYFTRLSLYDLCSMLYEIDNKYLKSNNSSIVEHLFTTLLLLTIIVEQSSSKTVCPVCKIYYDLSKSNISIDSSHDNGKGKNYFCYLRSRSISLSQYLLDKFTDGINAFIIERPVFAETVDHGENQCRELTISNDLDPHTYDTVKYIAKIDLTQEEVNYIVSEYVRLRDADMKVAKSIVEPAKIITINPSEAWVEYLAANGTKLASSERSSISRRTTEVDGQNMDVVDEVPGIVLKRVAAGIIVHSIGPMAQALGCKKGAKLISVCDVGEVARYQTMGITELDLAVQSRIKQEAPFFFVFSPGACWGNQEDSLLASTLEHQQYQLLYSVLANLKKDTVNLINIRRIDLEYVPQLKYLDAICISPQQQPPWLSKIKFTNVINKGSSEQGGSTIKSIREFMETWGLVPSDNIDMIISFFDYDENGLISNKEIQDTVLTYYFHEECYRDLFSKFDLDDDKRINLCEFIDYFTHLGFGEDSRDKLLAIWNWLAADNSYIGFKEFDKLYTITPDACVTPVGGAAADSMDHAADGQ